MPITFVGDKSTIEEAKKRIETGFHSLDRAFQDNKNNIGWPLPSYVEISGPKGVGKTSLALAISSIIAVKSNPQKRISLLDFEGQHLPTVEGICENAGYSGDVNLIFTTKDEQTEDTLERTVALLSEKNPDVILLDSIGAFSPSAEVEGRIGDSNMGVKAREVGQLAKKAVRNMLLSSMNGNAPTAFFTTNHRHPNIGFPGSNTSGGVTKNYMAHLAVSVKKVTAYDYDDLGWLMEGTVEKNRYGYTGRSFTVFLIGGEGTHLGLSDIFDCVVAGYARIDSGVLNMDGQKFGRMKSIIKNREHEKDVFIPFSNRLKAEELNNTVSNDEEGTESKDESNLQAKIQTTKRGRKKK